MHIQVPQQNSASSQRRHSKASHVKPQVLDENNASDENKQVLDASLLRALDDVDRVEKAKPSGATPDDIKAGNGDKGQKRYFAYSKSVYTLKLFINDRSIQRRNTVTNAKG
jgi:hypothetical protein